MVGGDRASHLTLSPPTIRPASHTGPRGSATEMDGCKGNPFSTPSIPSLSLRGPSDTVAAGARGVSNPPCSLPLSDGGGAA